MLKRTFDPIKTMIFGLRKYDLDRCIALRDSLAQARKEQQVRDERKEHAKNRKKGKHSEPQPQSPQAATTTTGGAAIPLVPPTATEHDSAHEQEHGLQQPMGTGVDHGLLKSDEQHLRAMATGHGPHVKGYFSYKSKVYLVSSPASVEYLT
jgi:mRNA deadenylase 3'-5' endonuclease subunit Ccr4